MRGREFLQARQITKVFGGNAVLRDVDFDVCAGEVHALIGENGAGKSTLMNILSGSFPPTQGTITVDGTTLKTNSPAEAMNAGIAMMHQEPKVAEALTVAENVFLGRLPKTGGIFVDWKKLTDVVDTVLRDIGAAFGAETRVSNLGVAQRQILQFARAMTWNARLIVMDEPTASLTPFETASLFDLVRRIAGRGIAFIYISHRLEEIFQIADRVTVLRDGAKVVTKQINDTSKPELISLMVGRDLGSHFPPRRAATIGPVALEAQNLSGPGFSGVSLQIRQGEIVGLAGLVGAGRTELARVLCGAERRTQGEMFLFGQRVQFRSPAHAVALGLAYLSEDRRDSVLRPLSVQQNITLATLRAIATAGLISAKAEREAAMRFVRRLDIRAASVDQLAGQLSGGNQQKCVIARWIMKQARVLLFDEPTRGVDVGAKREIYGLIHELAEAGCAILMISSELPEVINVSDRILVMCEGRLSGEIDAVSATENTIIAAAVPQAREATSHAQH